MPKLNSVCKCGSTNIEVDENVFGYSVLCKQCGVETADLDTRDEAISQWNEKFAPGTTSEPAVVVPKSKAEK